MYQYSFPMPKPKYCVMNLLSSFTLSFDSWSTDRKTVDTQLEYQVDLGTAQKINSPNYLIVRHQTADRVQDPNESRNKAVLDNLNVRKYHVDTVGVIYPRHGIVEDFATNDYLDQYRDVMLFYKEYVGEELLSPFIIYTDMKKKPIRVIDLRFQADRINP